MRREKNLGAVLSRVMATSRAASILTVLVIVLAVVTALFPPLVLERAVNNLTAGRGIGPGLALSYLGFLTLSGLLESGQNVMITVFGQKVTHGLRSALCAKLRRLPAAYFTSHEAGKTTSLFVNDVDASMHLSVPEAYPPTLGFLCSRDLGYLHEYHSPPILLPETLSCGSLLL